MDPNDIVLTQFERGYLDVHSISADRRLKQMRLLRRLSAETGRPIASLTANELSEFLGHELKRGLHPNTALKELSMVRSFVTWAEGAGVIDPVVALQLKSVRNPRGATRSKPRPYKAAEIRAFYALLAEKYPALPEIGKGSRSMARFMRGHVPRMRTHVWRHARRLQFEAQVALALEMGLRLTEIHNLTIPALHHENDQLVVLTAKQGPGRRVSRDIPYTAHARAAVQEWLDFRSAVSPPHQRPWLLLHYNLGLDEQVAPQTYRAHATSLREAFGPPWEWHRFRHTAATEWLRAEVPLEKLRVYMGHANIEQTLMYAEIVAGDIDRAFGAAEASFARRLGLAA